MRILIIDGQGGKVGRLLTEAVLQQLPAADITAVGTNTAATESMLKGGAHRAATGENAVAVGCRTADLILGPVGIAVADSMLGEITPRMALAVAQSEARKILVPTNRCSVIVAGAEGLPLQSAVARAVELACDMAANHS